MTKRYNITHSTNCYTRITGNLALQMQGGSNCLITKALVYKGIPNQRVVYCVENNVPSFMDNCKIKTITTCNVQNCINIDHIRATYQPTKDDVQYITDNLRLNGLEHQAHIMKIPPQLLQNYLDTHIDII